MVFRQTFEMKLKSLAQIDSQLIQSMPGAGTAGHIWREPAHIVWAVFIDDQIASNHALYPACLRILCNVFGLSSSLG